MHAGYGGRRLQLSERLHATSGNAVGRTRPEEDKLAMGFGGFSWKRAIGLSAVKARLSRRIGIPLTKGGRQRKLGKMISGGGCLVALVVMVAIPVALVALLGALF